MKSVTVVLIALLAIVFLVALAFAPVGSRQRGTAHRDWLIRFVVVAGMTMASVRVGSLWFLLYLRWVGRESLASLPFLILLYPEAFLLPEGFAWSVWGAALFSGVLAIGSFLGSVALAAVVTVVVHGRTREG